MKFICALLLATIVCLQLIESTPAEDVKTTALGQLAPTKLRGFWDWCKKAFHKVTTFVQQIAQGFSKVVHVVKGVIDKVVEFFAPITDKIKGFLEDVSQHLQDFVDKIKEQLGIEPTDDLFLKAIGKLIGAVDVGEQDGEQAMDMFHNKSNDEVSGMEGKLAVLRGTTNDVIQSANKTGVITGVKCAAKFTPVTAKLFAEHSKELWTCSSNARALAIEIYGGLKGVYKEVKAFIKEVKGKRTTCKLAPGKKAKMICYGGMALTCLPECASLAKKCWDVGVATKDNFKVAYSELGTCLSNTYTKAEVDWKNLCTDFQNCLTG